MVLPNLMYTWRTRGRPLRRIGTLGQNAKGRIQRRIQLNMRIQLIPIIHELSIRTTLGRRRTTRQASLLGTLRLLPLNLLQLFNIVDTPRHSPHHLLEPQLLLFPETKNLRLRLERSSFRLLQLVLQIIMLSSDVSQLNRRQADHVAETTLGVDALNASRRIGRGRLAGRETLFLTERTDGHCLKPTDHRRKKSVLLSSRGMRNGGLVFLNTGIHFVSISQGRKTGET